MKKVVAVDFDGVIHKYRYGYSDGTIYDTPTDDCYITMCELMKNFDEVVIYSTRAFNREVDGEIQPHQIEEMKNWLAYYQIPYTRIESEGKPIASYYIDDRGIRFENWQQALADIAEIEGFTTSKENSY